MVLSVALEAAQHPVNLQIKWPPKFVCILKVAEAAAPVVPAKAAADYPYGLAVQGGSLPIRYWIYGWLLRLPLVGKPVRVLRFTRDGVVMP